MLTEKCLRSTMDLAHVERTFLKIQCGKTIGLHTLIRQHSKHHWLLKTPDSFQQICGNLYKHADPWNVFLPRDCFRYPVEKITVETLYLKNKVQRAGPKNHL